MSTNTQEAVRDVVARTGGLQKDVGRLRDGDDLYSAGLTSHASVDLMLAVEDAFDVTFPAQLLTKATFSSISSIVAAVDSILADA